RRRSVRCVEREVDGGSWGTCRKGDHSMRTPRHGLLALIVVLACRGLPLPALSQTPSSPPSPAQLETLVAPIALYPDALVAQLLPASTNPLQVVEAARALAAGRRPDEAEASQWGYYFRILTAQGPAAPGG